MIPMPDDYTVRLVDMPVSAGGMISEDPDGHVNFYINARLSSVGQLNAARHEYDHWVHDDLHNDDGIRQVEVRAHCHQNKMRLLSTLKRASELPPPAKKTSESREVNDLYEDWKDDVIHKMPYVD